MSLSAPTPSPRPHDAPEPDSASRQPAFPLGRVTATPGALACLEAALRPPHALLARHAAGDWGDLPEADRQLNDQALKTGDRLLSAYSLTEARTIWIITEAEDASGQRAATTLLLPEEY